MVLPICVSVDLSEALVSYSDLLHSCPDTVFLVKMQNIFPDRLQRLLDLKARVMILLDIVDEEK